VHDRRWKKIVRLLRAAAFLNGRGKVDLMDCFLMVHCLWSQPGQTDKIREIVTESIRRHGYTMAVNLQMIKRETQDFEEDVDREIRVRHTVTEEQLQPVKDEYYELVKEDDKFDGVFLSVKQFNQLQMDNPQVTNFYDREFNLVNRLKAQKSSQQFTVEVFYNSERYAYPLRTRKAERTEVITKKPHHIVQQHWDERHQRLMSYITQQEEKIQSQAPDELNHLNSNLFVHKDHSEVVTRNLQEVREALEQLKLRLEKIQYAYTNI
jgi:MoxR-like ATPase